MRPSARFVLAATLALAACSRDEGLSLAPPGVDGGAPGGPDLAVHFQELSWNASVQNKVDVLFVIDNSDGMEAIQQDLQNRISQFLKPFYDLADGGTYANLNLGVVTTDIGAGVAGAPGCTPSGPRGGGDQGLLQALGRLATPDCLPPVGGHFIHYVFSGTGGGASNLPPGQTLLKTLTCMIAVGTGGCAYPHTLEAARLALTTDLPDNLGFLRPEAQLVVVFVTNKDDGSAPPESDLFSGAPAGYPDRYQRQTRAGVVCGQPPAPPPEGPSGGPLADCGPAPNAAGLSSRLYDVQRYVDFFTQPRRLGGVKDDPTMVALVAIDGTDAPFEVILSDPTTPWGQPYAPCGTPGPSCVPVLQRSCAGASPGLTADPAVRLEAVVGAVASHKSTSVCESDYTPALDAAEKVVGSSLGGHCLPRRVPRDGHGQPLFLCTVTDWSDWLVDGTPVPTDIPACDATHSTVPCWLVEPKAPCGPPSNLSPDGVGLTVDYGRNLNGMPAEPQPSTTTRASCQAID